MDDKINLLERNIIKILEREKEGKIMYEMEEERLKKELAELKDKYEKLNDNYNSIMDLAKHIIKGSFLGNKKQIKEILKIEVGILEIFRKI